MTFEEAISFLTSASPLRITVSGDIGSGKSTFAKRLAETLNIPRIYAGQIMREEAARRGMTLQAFNDLLLTDDAVDRQVDELQLDKSKEIDRGVFEGRLAWHFNVNPDAKVFFTVDPMTGAERVFNDTGNTLRDKVSSVEEAAQENATRKINEEKRYHDYYGISAYDRNNFDVVVDTSDVDQEGAFKNGVIAIAEFVKRARS